MPIKTCLVDGCDVRAYGRGLCNRHWQRWRRHGDPLSGTDEGAPKRFLESIFTHFKEDCIIWPFARDSNGYASVSYDGKTQYVSRIVCERFNGKPPAPKLDAAHGCGNGHLGCINGYHLRWATRSENCVDTLVHGTFKSARLSADDVIAIRELAGTKSHREIAENFGVARRTVCDVIKRNTWGHI
jgi:hypothetical protein